MADFFLFLWVVSVFFLLAVIIVDSGFLNDKSLLGYIKNSCLSLYPVYSVAHLCSLSESGSLVVEQINEKCKGNDAKCHSS